MKVNKKILLSLAFLSAGFLFVKQISAQIELPRITTACEMKSGALLGINDGFSILKKCPKGSRMVMIIGEQGPKGDQGETGPQGPQGEQGLPGPVLGKTILDVQQVRGANWENSDPTSNVATPDRVTINCPVACILWVNYDVDTRNTSAPFQHIYLIYIDGVDQAVFNQATMTTPNSAIPLAVNGVFPVATGQHTVAIYARTYGGTLQSFESHLQVLAIEQ